MTAGSCIGRVLLWINLFERRWENLLNCVVFHSKDVGDVGDVANVV